MNARMPNHRHALTVLETLVVLAILGVLTALLIPAVQRVRETSARMTCRNHLKQIATAAQNYDAVHGHLPPGYLGNLPLEMRGWDRRFWQAQWVGALAFLLPQMGHDATYRAFEVNWSLTETGPIWFSSAVNRQAANIRVAAYLCPWDDAYSNIGATYGALGMHTGGPSSSYSARPLHVRDPDYARIGRSNYAGVAGRMGLTRHADTDRYIGVFYNRSRVRIADVTRSDGASQVLMFGESLGDARVHPRQYSLSWAGVGCLPAQWGLTQLPAFGSFGSAHPHTVEFAWCDGSARPIRHDVRIETFNRLAGYQDGQMTGHGEPD